VVIPTYNSATTLEHCLDSIVTQSVPPKEIFIVDRFSTDDTTEIAKRFGTKVIQANANRSLGRNIGLKETTSDGIIFVDADMRLARDLIGECTELLKDYQALVIPEVSIGEGFWAKCKSLERRAHLDTKIEAARCFNRNALLSLGGYNPNLESGEDWDLHDRVRCSGLSIGRTKSILLHDEGEGSLLRILRKKFLYGSTMSAYLRANPRAPAYQLNPFSRVIATVRVSASDPIHGVGVFLLKALELSSAGSGWIVSKIVVRRHERTGQVDRAIIRE